MKWCNDLDSLKAFVAEVLDLNGKWCSPGGGSKRFTSSNAELTLTWYSGKQNTLLFQGKDGNLIRDGCVKFCQTRDGVMKSSCKQVQALSKNSELQRDLIAQTILESEPTSISRPANQVDAASQVCLDTIGDNSNRGALHSKKAYGIFGFLKIRGFFSGFSGFSPDFLADF